MDQCIATFPEGSTGTFAKFFICALADNFIFEERQEGEDLFLVLMPRNFHTEAVLRLPRGKLFRNLISLCPLLTVSRASNNITILLTSTQPGINTVRLATRPAEAFKRNANCQSCSKDWMLDLEYSIPKGIKLGQDFKCPSACQMELNVFPVDGGPCWEKWINVTNQADNSGPIDYRPEIQVQIGEFRDDMARRIARTITKADISEQIRAIERRSGQTTEQIRKAVEQVYIAAAEDITKQIGLPDKELEDFRRQIAEDIKKRTDATTANIEAGKADSIGQWRLINDTLRRTETIVTYMEEIQVRMNETLEAAARTRAAYEDWKKSQEVLGSCVFPDWTIIGPVFCGVANLASGLFDFLGGGGLKEAISIIIFICFFLCIAACILYCCIQCCPGIMANCSGMCRPNTESEKMNAAIKRPVSLTGSGLTAQDMLYIAAFLKAYQGRPPPSDQVQIWQKAISASEGGIHPATEPSAPEPVLLEAKQRAMARARQDQMTDFV
jgi:hypothetical protein